MDLRDSDSMPSLQRSGTEDGNLRGARAAVTEARIKMRIPCDGTGCRCRSGCKTATCKCRKSEMECRPDCKCFGPDHDCFKCENPYNNLLDLFGGECTSRSLFSDAIHKYTGHTPNACFKLWLKQRSNLENGVVDIEKLEEKISADCDAFKQDVELRAWRDERNRIEEGLAHENVDGNEIEEDLAHDDDDEYDEEYLEWCEEYNMQLLRVYALSTSRPRGEAAEVTDDNVPHIWSFCCDRWVDANRIRHCEDCDNCFEDAWHCARCKKCVVGRKLACMECGGVPRAGIDEQAASKAHTAKPANGRVPKRPRKSTVKERQMTEASVYAPDGIEKCTCDCEDSCKTAKCICREWGGGCKAGCSCRNADAQDSSAAVLPSGSSFNCWNPFNTVLPKFFGDGHDQWMANPCFTHFINRASPKAFNLTTGGLEKLLLKDKLPFEIFTPDELAAWNTKLPSLPAGSQERANHMQWFFRHVLGEKCDPSGSKHGAWWRWSFCIDGWNEGGNHHHCTECGECAYTKHVWHCTVCNKCRDNIFQPCKKCGGVSNMYEMGVEKPWLMD